MGKKVDSREEMLIQLMMQIRINYKVFEELLQSIETEELRNLVIRIKMQKDLFIRELKRIFKDKSFDFASHSSTEKEVIKEIMLEYASENAEETCFSIIRLREKHLLEIYDDLMINILKNEIAKMIIRNHINEIRRDLRALQDLHDNTVLQSAS